MPFKHRIACFFMFLIFTCLSSRASGDFKDFEELDIEALLKTEIISAAKRPQKLIESANAVYVITNRQIELSGAVDLPDLFRMVPGIDVINLYGNAYGVAARGFNDRFAQRMLVMIDGRTIYSSLSAGVWWENEQIFLEDIERIEIIRGPGATVWGANAVTGAINIITKDPEHTEGFLVTQRYGTKKYIESVLRYSDKLSDTLSVSLTAGYRDDDGSRGTHDHRRVPKATSRIKYQLSPDSVLNFFWGLNYSRIGIERTRYSNKTDTDIDSNYQMLRFEHSFSETSSLQIQAYRSSFESETRDRESDLNEYIYDLDLQHTFRGFNRHIFSWGLGYRRNDVKTGLFSKRRTHSNLFSMYFQDEIELLNSLSFVFGSRFERNSLTGNNISARSCFIYTPAENHVIRLSASRAIRTPSFAEKIYEQTRSFKLPPFSWPLIKVSGNKNLRDEKLNGLELGYSTTLFKKVFLNTELYYYEVDDFIDFFAYKKDIPFRVRFKNEGTAVSKGIELSLDIPLTNWWIFSANYTFEEVKKRRKNETMPGTPKHKLNIMTSLELPFGFTFSSNGHFVDDTKWMTPLGTRKKISSYFRLDARIAKSLFHDRVELSVTGQNLTDKLHRETSDIVGSYRIERLIYGQITFRFPL